MPLRVRTARLHRSPVLRHPLQDLNELLPLRRKLPQNQIEVRHEKDEAGLRQPVKIDQIVFQSRHVVAHIPFPAKVVGELQSGGPFLQRACRSLAPPPLQHPYNGWLRSNRLFPHDRTDIGIERVG